MIAAWVAGLVWATATTAGLLALAGQALWFAVRRRVRRR